MRFFVAFIALICTLILSSTLRGLPHKTQDNIKVITLSSKNSVSLHNVIDAGSSYKVQQGLMDLASASRKPIYLVLNSPGGSIEAGRKIIDTAQGIDNEVNTISLFSASMSFITSQYLDHRYVLDSSTLMSHRAAADGVGGEIPGSLINRALSLLSMTQEIDAAVARRANIPINKYQELVRDELWLTGPQAISMGFADELVRVRCDKSLSGPGEKEEFVVFGFKVRVVWHSCPLITQPIEATIDNKAPEATKNKAELFLYNPALYLQTYGANY